MDIEYVKTLLENGYTPEAACEIAKSMDKLINNTTQKEGK